MESRSKTECVLLPLIRLGLFVSCFPPSLSLSPFSPPGCLLGTAGLQMWGTCHATQREEAVDKSRLARRSRDLGTHYGAVQLNVAVVAISALTACVRLNASLPKHGPWFISNRCCCGVYKVVRRARGEPMYLHGPCWFRKHRIAQTPRQDQKQLLWLLAYWIVCLIPVLKLKDMKALSVLCPCWPSV